MSPSATETNPLRQAFARARAEGRPALVVYVMAGDPSLEATRALVPQLAQAGADIVELGVPFSDPVADGPVIQAAGTRALATGTTLARVLALAADLRGTVPLVLMGYLNPVVALGEEKFARTAGEAGVAGVILPDLPMEEAGPLAAQLRAHGVSLVPLVAPTTPAPRLRDIARTAEGFVYYVSVTGVTGARAGLPADLAERLEAARQAAAPAPLAVGFGIGNAEQARAVAPHADGLVVGSAVVRALHEQGPAAALALVRDLRRAIERR